MADYTWAEASQAWSDSNEAWEAADVSVTLTGFELTTSLGSVIASIPGSVAVMGQQIAVDEGDVTVKAGGTFPVTGHEVTVELGDVTVIAILGDVFVQVEGFSLEVGLAPVEVTSTANVYVTGESIFVFDGIAYSEGKTIALPVSLTLTAGLGDVTVKTNNFIEVVGMRLNIDLGRIYYGAWQTTMPEDEFDDAREMWTAINGGGQDWTNITPPPPKPQDSWIDGVIPHG